MEVTIDDYIGEPLCQQNSFRLIEIQPGELDETITVRLMNTTLQECPTYEALSYAWGNTALTESIQVITTSPDGVTESSAPLDVTRSCADALQRLRLCAEPRWLWVDSICINQSLVPERNRQLQLMPCIYSGSSRVVVYLGESSGPDGSDAVMDWLGDIHTPSDASGHQPPPDTGVICAFLERPWFTRVWVLQEIQLAKKTIVVCGDRELEWEAFRELRDWWRNTKRRSTRRTKGWPRRFQFPYAVQCLVTSGADSVPALLGSYPERLLRLLQKTRDLGATDARDKIFAILPLLTLENDRYLQAHPDAHFDDLDPSGFEVPKGDYQRPPAELFVQLAQDLINALGLHILYSGVVQKKLPGLPSWTPDWSSKDVQGFHDGFLESGLLGSDYYIWAHDGEVPNAWHFSNYNASDEKQGVQLHVNTAMVDTIMKVGELCDVYNNSFPLEQWEDLCDPVHLTKDEEFSPFVHALFFTRVIYSHVANQAVERIKKYNLERVGNGSSTPPVAHLEADRSTLPERYRSPISQVLALEGLFRGSAPSNRIQSEEIFHVCHMQRFFVTESGRLGLASEATRAGDQIMVIQGLRVPFIVRADVNSVDGLQIVQLVGTAKAVYAPEVFEERMIR